MRREPSLRAGAARGGAGDARAVMLRGGGGRREGEGGSWWDSLRWAEGGGGCYTIAPGKAEHLQIPAAERGQPGSILSPPAGRAAAAAQDEASRSLARRTLPALSPPPPARLCR